MSTILQQALKTAAAGVIATTLTACGGSSSSNAPEEEAPSNDAPTEAQPTLLPAGDLDTQLIQDGGEYAVLGDTTIRTAYTHSDTEFSNTGTNTFQEIAGHSNTFNADACEGFDITGDNNTFEADRGCNIRGNITGTGTEIITPAGIAGFNETPIADITVTANDVAFFKDTDDGQGNGRTTINLTSRATVGGSTGSKTDFNIAGASTSLTITGDIDCGTTFYSQDPAVVAVSYNGLDATDIVLSGGVERNAAQLGFDCKYSS